MNMTIDDLESGNRCIRLSGPLNITGVQAVELQFTASVAGSQKSVIVDLSAVNFIASIGIRMFFTNARTLAAHGAKIVIVNPQPMVEEVLKLAGLNTVVPIERDLAAAEKLLVCASNA